MYHSKTDYRLISSELLKKEKTKTEINFKTEYESICKIDYIKQIGEEGIEFIDQDTIDKQRSVVSYMIKKIGSNLLSGQSIMNTSLPIYIFEERSLLQSFGYKFRFASQFLSAAADAANIERLKQTASFVFCGLHTACTMFKPFNPILGETYQAKIGQSMCYFEQTSHHPPILNYYIKNPGFECYGNELLVATTAANSLVANFKGKYFVKYSDGVVLTYTPPEFVISGVVMGKRLLNYKGDIVVQDKANDLICVIHINPSKSGFFSKLFSSKSTFADYSAGFIAKASDCKFDKKTNSYKVDKKYILSNIEGEWTGYLKFDDRFYWKHGEVPLDKQERMEFTLPSDSCFRDDVLLFKEGNLDLAQQAKTNLEEIQRNDRKLRGKFNKK